MAKIGLIVISAILWGFSIWQGIRYAWYQFGEGKIFEKNLATFSDYTLLAGQFAAQPLKVTGTEVFQGGINNYDLVAEVANVNDHFLADFDYYFTLGETRTVREHTFLLPGENRPVATLGLDSVNSSFGTPVIHLENVHWQRIDSGQFPSPRHFQEERLQFSVHNVVFTRADATGGTSSHRITFDLTNASAYGYSNAVMYVGLYLQQSLVGIMRLEEPNFHSLETRTVDLRSFVPDLNITDVQVFPLINVYDPGIFLKPS